MHRPFLVASCCAEEVGDLLVDTDVRWFSMGLQKDAADTRIVSLKYTISRSVRSPLVIRRHHTWNAQASCEHPDHGRALLQKMSRPMRPTVCSQVWYYEANLAQFENEETRSFGARLQFPCLRIIYDPSVRHPQGTFTF